MIRPGAVPLALALVLCAAGAPALAKTTAPDPPAQEWGFRGLPGRYDLAAARRGYQVYSQSCAACHSLMWLHYRDLTGIGLTVDQVAAITAKLSVPAGVDSAGKPVNKPATPASVFVSPFPSEEAARAAMNGALPPDLSLAANVLPGGPDYIAALLTGYRDPPAGEKLADGMNYNLYFPGQHIAMPPPLADGQIAYTDGTASSVAQNARDVAVFLAWAANPEMDERKHLGFRVVGYFLAMAGVAYALQRRIWAQVK
jgi:ubiquinol-cytochrome c reductase cytochrome c1 subunit